MAKKVKTPKVPLARCHELVFKLNELIKQGKPATEAIAEIAIQSGLSVGAIKKFRSLYPEINPIPPKEKPPPVKKERAGLTLEEVQALTAYWVPPSWMHLGQPKYRLQSSLVHLYRKQGLYDEAGELTKQKARFQAAAVRYFFYLWCRKDFPERKWRPIYREVANKLNLNALTFGKWVQKVWNVPLLYWEAVLCDQRGKPHKIFKGPVVSAAYELIRKEPSLTHHEIADRLNAAGTHVSAQTIQRYQKKGYLGPF